MDKSRWYNPPGSARYTQTGWERRYTRAARRSAWEALPTIAIVVAIASMIMLAFHFGIGF